MLDSIRLLPARKAPSRTLAPGTPGHGASGGGALAFGLHQVDHALNGGMQRDGLHEFHAPDHRDRGAALALPILLAMQACHTAAPLIWLRGGDGGPDLRPYGPGLAMLGIDPDVVVLVQLRRNEDVLWAGVESLRQGGFGAVLLEMGGRAPQFDLTASRRLALAARRSATPALVVRSGSGARPVPSAAHTRWQVQVAASAPLSANAPGHPVFDLHLLRQRGGPDGLHLQLEWDCEQAGFRAPLSGGAPAVPVGSAADQVGRRAA